MTEALRARLGPGARFDDPAAPHDDLLAARRATADFARVLNALSDDDLTPPRRLVVAKIGYEARTIAYGIEALSNPTIEPFDLAAHISRGVTLPARALRFLIQHSAIHLNVTWRDLDAAGWKSDIVIAGRKLPVNTTPNLRGEALRIALDQL